MDKLNLAMFAVVMTLVGCGNQAPPLAVPSKHDASPKIWETPYREFYPGQQVLIEA